MTWEGLLMNAGDWTLLFGAVVIATLFVALIWLGYEYYRLSQHTLDTSRVKSLIALQPRGEEVEAAARCLWERLVEDSEQLGRLAHRMRDLMSDNEEPKKTAP